MTPLRPASSVILLRDDGAVLFVRRRQGMSFFGGAHVFPGGRVEAHDAEAGPVSIEALPRLERILGEPLPSREALGFYVAAARELFEEAGVLLCRERPEAHERGELRRRLEAGEGLAAALAALGMGLDLAPLVPWAHWLTPSIENKRFDTWFFVARLPEGQDAELDLSESSELVWLRASEALAAAERGEVMLPPPTVRHLEDLGPHGSPGEVLAFAARRRIAPIQPKLLLEGDAPAVLMPWDPEYAAAPGEAGPPGAQAEGGSRIVLDGGRWRSK